MLTPCLAFAAPGPQDSTLTLSGLVDMGFSYLQGADNSRLTTRSGGQSASRITLSGSEGLGGGWMAAFRLQNVFNAGNGKSLIDGRLFNSVSWLSFSGPPGELRLGRQPVLGSQWGSFDEGFDGGWGGAGDSIIPTGHGDTGRAARMNQSVIYYSPALAGFKAAAGYSFRVGDGDTTETDSMGRPLKNPNDRVFTAGLQYAKNEWTAGLTLDGLIPEGQDRRRTRNWQTGVAYATDNFGWSVNYGLLVNPNRGPAKDRRRSSAFIAGAHYRMTPNGILRLAVQRSVGIELKSVALGYQYDLSKRSNLYVYAIQRSGGILSRRVIALGMRHRF